MVLTLQFLFPNQSLTWIVSLFHTRHKNCPIWSLITTKTLFYWANIDNSGFSGLTSARNLLNYHALWWSRACTKERKCSVHLSIMAHSYFFNTVHHKSGIFHPLLKYFGLNLLDILTDNMMKNSGHILN